jgi:phosphatidylglycerol:prolipoprotein diacylglycerol transferase
MYPVLFEVGGIIVPSWHIFFVLGAIAAFFTISYLCRTVLPQVPEHYFSQLFGVGYIGGYFGARFLSIIIEQPEIRGIAPMAAAMFELGPMTMYGGMIGCFSSGLIYCLWRKMPVLDVASISFVGGILAVGVGRIGCFLNGDDYGTVVPLGELASTPWWAVTFPNHENPLPRYPVQLIEAGFCILTSLLVIFNFKKIAAKISTKWVGILLLSAYCVFRFIIEYWRGDERGWVIPNILSPSQLISILILASLPIAVLVSRRISKKVL